MLHVLSFDHLAFMRKTQQPARLADENDYGGWEALWTDDALYWVPVDSAGSDPVTSVSVIYDNRRRITTRLSQLRTGKRYVHAPPSTMRRIISNIEILGLTEIGDTEVGANFLLLEARARGTQLWGGQTTYRLREVAGGVRLSCKKVVLVDLDQPEPHSRIGRTPAPGTSSRNSSCRNQARTATEIGHVDRGLAKTGS